MKVITVSVPDNVYYDARVAATQRDTSLSALVVSYLERLSGRMNEIARLEALQQEVQAEIGQFRAADRLGRDEVHFPRAGLRRSPVRRPGRRPGLRRNPGPLPDLDQVAEPGAGVACGPAAPRLTGRSASAPPRGHHSPLYG